jgi:Tfp pilus assembly PilM family ATPase/Tfp pilus assembly protein PilN
LATRNVPRRAGHATRAVAVDIGSAVVRAVEVEINGPEARLLKRGFAPAPPGVWENLTASREALAQAIKSAMSSAGISGTQVIAAIPRRLVTLKYARLPHAEPEHIAGMVQFEAQQYIPFPLDEVVLDHQIVSDESDEMTSVMIVAARRSLVDDLLGAFDKAGLEVVRLSVSALALAEHAQGGALPMALLEVEAGEMDLAVVSAGRLLFTRAAGVGDVASSGAVGNRLASEVAQSLTAYQNEYRAQPVSKLLVAAPPGDIANVEQTLTDLLDVPIGRMNGRLLPPADPDALAYATAAGLALEAGGGGVSRINLVPTARLERKVAARRKVNAGLAVAGAAALAVVAGIMWSNSLAAEKDERAKATVVNRKLEFENKALLRAKSEHSQAAKTYTTVSSALARTKPAVDIVKAVSDAIPKGSGIYLSQLSFERGGNVAIHGNAKNETAATDLVIALQASGVFNNVRLAYLGDAQTEMTGPPSAGAAAQAKPKPGENMSFLVTCRLQGEPAKPKALEGALATSRAGGSRP